MAIDVNTPHPLDYRQPQHKGPTLLQRLPYIASGVVIGTLLGLIVAGLGRAVLTWAFDILFNDSKDSQRQLREAIAGMILTAGSVVIGWVVGGWAGSRWARARFRKVTGRP